MSRLHTLKLEKKVVKRWKQFKIESLYKKSASRKIQLGQQRILNYTAIKAFKLFIELKKIYEKDLLLKKVWRCETSWYDIDLKRLILEEDHALNFFQVENKRTNNVNLELEVGCHAPVCSDDTS